MSQAANSDIAVLTAQLRRFRDERDWGQFHQPKDLAIALSVEASELLELYLWKSSEDPNPDRVREELADVFAYALLLADRLGLDVREIVEAKLRLNAAKYPVNKSRGSNRKYTELGS